MINLKTLEGDSANEILIRLAKRDRERYRKLIDLNIERHSKAKELKSRIYYKSQIRNLRNKLRLATIELNKLT